MINFFKIFTFIAIFNSCSVGPNYKSPDIDLPEDFQEKSRLTVINTNTDNEKKFENWWDNFNDPILSNLINESIKSNLSILQAVERIEQARAATRQTFFGLFPTPTITGQYLKSKIAGVRFPGIASNGIQFELYSLGLEANWEIDLFGKIRRAIESNESLAIASAYSLDDAVRLIEAQIATAYIQLRGAQTQKLLTQKTINHQKEILKLLEKRYEIGDLSPLELERAKVLTSRTEAMISQFDVLIDINIHRLASLSGSFKGDLIEKLKINSDLPNYIGPGFISSPEQLIRRRPDVRAAEQNLHAATADIGVAVADLFPQISIFGSINQEAIEPSNLFSSNSEAFNYGPRVSWSILNLGAILNNIEVRKARSREILLRYKEVIINTIEEVDNAISELATELERSSHLQTAFNSSKNAFEISEIYYKEGSISFIDYLSSEQEMIETMSELNDSKTRKSLAYVSLYRALGGSWNGNKNQEENY